MNWKECILKWKPETEWQPIIDKWIKENPNPESWFTLWIWPENSDPKQTEYLKKLLKDREIKYTEKYDYGNELPAAIDSVVYCAGDLTVENANSELNKITLNDKGVFYEGVHVALIGQYMDEQMFGKGV